MFKSQVSCYEMTLSVFKHVYETKPYKFFSGRTLWLFQCYF